MNKDLPKCDNFASIINPKYQILRSMAMLETEEEKNRSEETKINRMSE